MGVPTTFTMLPLPPENIVSAEGYDYEQAEATPLEHYPKYNPVLIEIPPPLLGASEEQCREALVKYVESHKCWRVKPAREGRISSRLFSSIEYLKIESHVEVRDVERTVVPYRGEPYSAVGKGTPVKPWDVDFGPCTYFAPTISVFEIPFTSSIFPCYQCTSTPGNIKCYHCGGEGNIDCGNCHCTGKKKIVVSTRSGEQETFVNCTFCAGKGHDDCLQCNNIGTIRCPLCKGFKNVRTVMKLVSKHKVNTHEQLVKEELLPFPQAQLGTASKLVLLQVDAPLLPTNLNWTSDINAAYRVNEKYARDAVKAENSKLLQQKLTVEAIPVVQVTMQWQETEFHYVLFGSNMRVYCLDYPTTCCSVL